MNHEHELLEQLRPERERGEIEVRELPRSFIETIESRFPFVNSKIDWDGVPGAIVRRFPPGWSTESYANAADRFVQELIDSRAIGASQVIVVVGEGPVDVALVMAIGVLSRCVRRILDVPQHTYVAPVDGGWCVLLTMEGDLCFGVAPLPLVVTR
jgi:hypothetical protein